MKAFQITTTAAALTAIIFTACETTGGAAGGGNAAGRPAMNEAIKNEPVGAYHVGRRYYKVDYKFWGFVRKSGQPWSTAQLVMLDENTQLAPDRAMGKIGADNNYEYKLSGDFTGDRVYEPASNRFYPEFRLRGAELLSAEPAAIYREQGATNPTRRIIAKPY